MAIPDTGPGAATPPRALRWELLVNLAGTGYSALVQLACIPVFLAMLGAERYGLLAFGTTMALALKALDLGIGHSINRELASRRASGRTDGTRELLRTIETAYATIGVVLGGALAVAAPVIATRWFGASLLGAGQVTDAVRVIGLIIAVQWPLSLYQSALLGLGQSTTMNAAAIASSTLSGGGAMLLLFAGHRSLMTVLLWQLAIAAAHSLVVAVAAHRALPSDARPARVDRAILGDLRRTMTTVGALTLSLLLLLQADKLLASRWLPLAGYGYYMLAATVANGLGVLSAPVFNTLLPRLAALAAGRDPTLLEAEFRRGTRLIALIVLPAMIMGVVLAADLLRLWTRSGTTASFAAAPASLLLVGMGCASLLQLAMALQLATGRTARGARINALCALAFIPLGVLGSGYGALGVAGVWSALVALAAVGGGALVYREQLGVGAGRWLLVDIGRPLAAMLAVTLIAWPLLHAPVSVPVSALRLLALGAVLMAVSALASGFRRSKLPRVLDPAA